jgi:hypothetical protein
MSRFNARVAGARGLGLVAVEGEQATLCSGARIEYLIADGNADARLTARSGAKNAERQILNREVASRLIGAFDPRPHRGVMRFVGARGHRVASSLECHAVSRTDSVLSC